MNPKPFVTVSLETVTLKFLVDVLFCVCVCGRKLQSQRRDFILLQFFDADFISGIFLASMHLTGKLHYFELEKSEKAKKLSIISRHIISCTNEQFQDDENDFSFWNRAKKKNNRKVD